MADETITLRLIELQTAAALIAAGAAVAMWKATANLVRATRDMLLANVAPELLIRLENVQPFKAPKTSTVMVKNEGSVDLVDVRLEVGPCFKSDDKTGTTELRRRFEVGTLKAGETYKFPLWDIAKDAVHQQRQLSDSYGHARAEANTEVEVRVSSRHSATGMRHKFVHYFLVQFDQDGALTVSELFKEEGREVMKVQNELP